MSRVASGPSSRTTRGKAAIAWAGETAWPGERDLGGDDGLELWPHFALAEVVPIRRHSSARDEGL